MRNYLHAALLAGAVLATGLAVQTDSALADGQPVISLAPTTLGRTGITINSDRASALVSAPVVGFGPGPDHTAIYDLSRTQPVVSLPVRRIVTSGENTDIEYDTGAGAGMPHTMPDVGGSHNAGLWNLLRLPNAIR